MSQEKRLDQWNNENHTNSVTLMTYCTQVQTCITGHSQGSTFKQTHSTNTIPMDLRNSTEPKFSTQ